jgi:hypothetical protein
VDISPCIVFYSHDPAGMLAGLVESTEQEMRALIPGRHNVKRLAELARALVQYRQWLAAAEGRQPRQPA